MKIYVYLDESGSIHKNSKTKYFAVGGYFVFECDKNKTKSKYKRLNKIMHDSRNLDYSKEIKSFDMTIDEKKGIFNQIQKIETFFGCAKIFKKDSMDKEIIESNIFYNYAVKLVFVDCIFPLLDLEKIKEPIEFIVSVDNRNISIGDIKNLETYLRTEFCLLKMDFKVTYYDSATNFSIQLADLIINTFYNKYKKPSIVNEVFITIKTDKFRVSLFPGNKVCGRIEKITYNSGENS